jgi:hypothetical protein
MLTHPRGVGRSFFADGLPGTDPARTRSAPKGVTPDVTGPTAASEHDLRAEDE